MSKYKSKWEPNSRNEPFWIEILVGKKITGLEFNEQGISGFILDTGERVFLTSSEGQATLGILD